ncbi:L,D-transpeptidase Cds6 family protein [Aquifex sp.]
MINITILSFILSFFSFGFVELERGEIDKLLLKAAENKASPTELKALKAYFENLEITVEKYLEYYAKGLVAEQKGELDQALKFYLRSIKLRPDYNPSYYRFNFLIRKVSKPEVYRKEIESILKERFKKVPPVILANPKEHYVFLVEKMSQYLLVFKGNKLVEMHPVTTGKNIGDKWIEGDGKTPEGIYYFTRFIPPEELSDIYGGLAAALNYPNPYDKYLGKSGSGIWLHGSNEDNRNYLPFSTRGCIVADNKTLRERIFPKINLHNTLIGIYKVIPRHLKVEDIKNYIMEWKTAWENKDFDKYISFYSSHFKWKGGGFREWVEYKRRTVLGKKYIKVKISRLTILAFREGLKDEPTYYVAEFFQEYDSDTYSDKGIKRMYILKEGGKLKILAEEFQEIK